MPFDHSSGVYTSPLGSIPLPSKPATIYDFLFDAAASPHEGYQRPDPRGRTWILDAHSSKSYTYEQAKERADDIARALHFERGLREGDSVVVFSPNDIDYGPALWGTFRQGGVVSCANPAYNADEFAHQLKMVHEHHPIKAILVHPDAAVATIQACEKSNISSKLVVLMHRPASSTTNVGKTAEGLPTLDSLVSASKRKPLPPKFQMKAEDQKTKLALLSFSSGTTGLPKAVCIPHWSVICNVLQTATFQQKTKPLHPYDAREKKGDVVMACLPFYHIYGLVVVLHSTLYQSLPIVVLPRFEARNFLDTIASFRISVLYLVPPQVVLMVKQDFVKEYDLSSVRYVMAGAAPLTEEVVKAFQARFPQAIVGQGYGMTESSTVISMYDATRKDFPGSSAGCLVPNIEAKIVSPEGKALPPGEVGELWSRGPSNALGYLANEKATNETFDSDGFLHTGDEARFDDDCLFIVDRLKELIKANGFQVAPAELEGFLLSHPDVQDVCVIGIPDEKRGEAPKAFVVVAPAAASRLKSEGGQAEQKLVDELKKYVTDNKIRYKALAEVEFLEAIPKTPSGKLLRKDRESFIAFARVRSRAY
ncbi:phenylacetyl-CoA ligase [Rhodotorula sp. JG-1b]|nr:phenylacetyl-CoA ligase [Rhodotorula sp. JG-1b]